MKLEHVLENLNSFEKNPFLKIIDNIISSKPKNSKEIEKILTQPNGSLKNAENQHVSKVLDLVKEEYSEEVRKEFLNTTSQLDIIIDIIIRDGNCLMSREWLGELYKKEIVEINKKIAEFKKLLNSDDNDPRIRDYRIYKECLKSAYHNDGPNERDNKITKDEQSILNTLISQMDISHEEVKLVNYDIVPLVKNDLDEIIKYITNIGIAFYSKRNYQIYIADEIVEILRNIRGKEVSDKIFRRVLRHLKDVNINQLARKHNIDRKLTREEKINEIIRIGVNFTAMLTNGIFKEDTTKTDRRNFINNLIDKELCIDAKIKGLTSEEKIKNLIAYLILQEKDDSIGISMSGYEKMLKDLSVKIPTLNKRIRAEFELEEENVCNAKLLLTYNLKPMDILYLLEPSEVREFCLSYGISPRGNEIQNILDSYKNIEDLYIENYKLIANRSLTELNSRGISIKESEIGLKFEEITKIIFKKMGLQVDEKIKQEINTSKDKSDIVIKIGEKEIIIIECKSLKEKGYNKYSSVSRQVRSYREAAQKQGYYVKKTFIIAPDFTDDFISDCELDHESNLSLMHADTLLSIYEKFIGNKLKQLPITLLTRDVLINKDRVLKSMDR